MASLRERLGNVDYAKYRSYVYNFTTFVSALIVLVISIGILIITALMYPKVMHVFKTIEKVEKKIDELLNTSLLDIVEMIVGLIVGLFPLILGKTTTTRSLLRSAVISEIGNGPEAHVNAVKAYKKLSMLSDNKTAKDTTTVKSVANAMSVLKREQVF
jgi:hypothetical protein